MPDAVEAAPISSCPDCGGPLATVELSCPGCQRLVHAEALKKIAMEAEHATSGGNLSAALALWRQALDLLPPDSNQYNIIHQKVIAISGQLSANPAKAIPTPNEKRSIAGIFGAIGAVVVFLLTKAKFLLLGLSKASTIFSMLAFLGVYWVRWGWQFALGFVLCIYIHEMGHVAALRKYGIAATAPMFIPGLGAFIRVKQYPATPSEDAYVGLAGPAWGLGASLIVYLLFLYTGNALFAALTFVSAMLNLGNMLPAGSLDGGRGFRALSRWQRLVATISLGVALHYASAKLAILVLFVSVVIGAFRIFSRNVPKEPDGRALAKYVLLVAALTALMEAAYPAGMANLVPKSQTNPGNNASPTAPDEDDEGF